ncbi:hypothetical protein L484_018145 [Morus notabilis]|uniref:DUF1985 domain-containing protein n=1 Tax=Morus notabilis TaxID=981085 RepID=W9RHQ7_9ROSA|nr:hypothetical protein L484_018145 [Morus notabilis]
MWMKAQGTPMRFSMEEYAMITGLNFAPVKADEKLERAKKNTHLKHKHFNAIDNVSVVDPEKMLKGMEPIEDDDRTKISSFVS